MEVNNIPNKNFCKFIAIIKNIGDYLSYFSFFFNKSISMGKEKKLWTAFVLVTGVSFAVLGYYGYEIYQKAPPLPERVITTDGTVIFEGQDIKDGQNVWQSMGGQEVGSVWGHGAYVAPDWTADWLHREARFILNKFAQADFNKDYDAVSEEQQAALKIRLQKDLRTNTYNSSTGEITVSQNRAEAVAYLSDYYKGLI